MSWGQNIIVILIVVIMVGAAGILLYSHGVMCPLRSGPYQTEALCP